MSHKTGFIHDKEYDEYYIPEELQCENCNNEAVIDGLCNTCRQENKLKDLKGWTTEALVSQGIT